MLGPITRRIAAAMVFGLMSVCQGALAQEARPDLQILADTLLADTGSPGVVVAVYDAGVVTEAVAGERARGSGVAVATGDQWHLGSITKSMTAVLAARLVASGAVTWDDTLGDVLGAAVPDIDPAYAAITYRHLLSHRSGMVPNAGLMTALSFKGTDAARDAAADRVRYAKTVLGQAPAAAAEAEFVYSNAGYIVAALMMETQTGRTWEDLITTQVFTPLALESAGFGPPGAGGASPNQPVGHTAGLFGGLQRVGVGAAADNPPALNPAGRVHLTAADMLAYAAAHMAGARGQTAGDDLFLDPALWATLHAPPFGGDYALGWGVGDGFLSHCGSNTAWLACVRLWPQADRAVFIAANDGRTSELNAKFRALFDALAPQTQ